MGIDQVPLFDAHIEIYTDNERIKIQYDTYVPLYLRLDTSSPDLHPNLEKWCPACLPPLTFRPYIKGLPITITTQSRLSSGEYSSQTIRPTYEDPYTLEFRELYACIVEGKEARTSVVDARRDTELAIEIIKALK
jgi:hypothetical protein